MTDTLSTIGAGAFGSSMPLLAPTWTTGQPTADADGMTLTLAAGAWQSPLAGYVRTPAQVAERSGVFLRRSNGGGVPAAASVVSLYPQQYLRLTRLFAQVLEDVATARPERALGLPARPVPAHVVLEAGGIAEGGVDPADALVGGALSFHDRWGQPIDALAVASAFLALMTAHPPLQARAATAAFDPNPGLAAMVMALAPAPAQVRVRLTSDVGMPAASARLTGLTLVSAPAAIHTVGTGRTIGKDAVSAGFPADEHQSLVVGLATSGRLADAVTLPSLPTGVTLARDFFSVRLLDLRTVLLGTPAPTWAGTKIEPRPKVRRDEPVTFLPDGNDVLGAAVAALTGTSLAESIVVAPVIDGAFAAPSGPGTAAHWPSFPPLGAVTQAPAGAVATALRAALAPTAANVAGTVDVVLTLNGLPTGAWVRAYHRLFSADAVESRGDGAGGAVDGTGTVRLLLRDPFALRSPGQNPTSLPAQSILHVDVVVVKRGGEARIFGDVSAPVTGTATFASTASNAFGSATRRAVCNASILGLAGSPVPPAGTSLVSAALSLLSEGTPRDAPRLAGMARRDLLVAGLAAPTGGAWRSVLGAGRLAPELHNAAARLGAPGGSGGRETQAVGVATEGGRLAYDIARAGLRRTTSIFTRFVPLVGGTWNEPPATTTGTFAGAVLQTVAAACETPELALLRTFNLVDPDDPNFPRTFNALLDRVKQWLTALVGQLGLPAGVASKANELITKVDELKDNTPNDESLQERIFYELLREVAASGWGRRDAQWALQGAFGQAQRFIYIETPGIAPTMAPTPPAGPAPGPFAANLFETLTARLQSTPSLHLIVCCPQQPDYPRGFTPWTDYEAAARRTALLNLPTASNPDPVGSRVVVFHPIGFPGRPSRLESTVVIVDDVWALVGSSTVRRRGLTFDGGADLVCTDLVRAEGRSDAIANFRRTLQADRLGVPRPPTAASMPASSWVRLSDGVEAFHEIREVLRAGGLGRIARLAPAEPVGRTAAPGPIDVVDPDGETVDFPRLLAELLLAGAATA